MTDNNTLFIIRGLPGSAKTTLGKMLSEQTFAADDFFEEEDGSYNFDPAKLGEAHGFCKIRVEQALAHKCPVVSVCNTFTQAWEAAPYFELAKKYGYRVSVIHCQNDFGNVHGVPVEAIERMKERWEENIWPV